MVACHLALGLLLAVLLPSAARAGEGDEGDACATHSECGEGLYCTQAEECGLCDDDGEPLCTVYRDSIDGSCAPCGAAAAPTPPPPPPLPPPPPPLAKDTAAPAVARRGEVVAWDAREFSLAADGMAILPHALTGAQLAELNLILDMLLTNLNATVTDLDPAVLQRNAASLATRDTVDSHNGFCFGDISQRGPGKYEIRVPELDLYPPPPPPITEKRPWVPPLPLFPPELKLANHPAWRDTVLSALGEDAELRSATVILSVSHGIGPLGEASTSQHWHSDGTLPPAEYMGIAYGVVVYIPLKDVPPHGGRVEYLPGTHSQANKGKGKGKGKPPRVDRNGNAWNPAWGVDLVTPPMDAGVAVIYDYTTQHRGLKSTVGIADTAAATEAEEDSSRNVWRPVLKLDYFRAGVGTKSQKDGWCPQHGYLTRARKYSPPP